MSVVDFAAFHPIFFLHHCQIDRLFEAHLTVNKEAKVRLQQSACAGSGISAEVSSTCERNEKEACFEFVTRCPCRPTRPHPHPCPEP